MGGCSNLTIMILTTLISLLAFIQIQTSFTIWGTSYFKNKDIMTSRLLIIPNIIWPFLGIYIAFFRSGSFYMGGVYLGRKLHALMTFKLLYADINNFLKRTPIGIIINRFSNDVDNLDNGISAFLDLFFLSIIGVFATTLIIVGGSRSFLMLVPLSLYSLIALYIRKLYITISRELTRLKAITKSPVVGTCNSCIKGGPLVRSLKKRNILRRK